MAGHDGLEGAAGIRPPPRRVRDQSLIGGTGGGDLPGVAGATGSEVAAVVGTVAVVSALVAASVRVFPAAFVVLVARVVGATLAEVPLPLSGFCDACSVGFDRGSGGDCGRAGVEAAGKAGCDPGAPPGPIPVGAPSSAGEP